MWSQLFLTSIECQGDSEKREREKRVKTHNSPVKPVKPVRGYSETTNSPVKPVKPVIAIECERERERGQTNVSERGE